MAAPQGMDASQMSPQQLDQIRQSLDEVRIASLPTPSPLDLRVSAGVCWERIVKDLILGAPHHYRVSVSTRASPYRFTDIHMEISTSWSF